MNRHAISLLVLCAGIASLPSLSAMAQEPALPQPGPEHALLKESEGTWEANTKMADGTTMPGVMTFKMECGGLWLVSDYKAEVPGFKFQGKGMDGYDPMKKKYVSVWVDSVTTSPMTLEGTYDEATKTMTMAGGGTGSDGKPLKVKNVTKITDKDHQTLQMFTINADGKEELQMTIEFTRKK